MTTKTTLCLKLKNMTNRYTIVQSKIQKIELKYKHCKPHDNLGVVYDVPEGYADPIFTTHSVIPLLSDVSSICLSNLA